MSEKTKVRSDSSFIARWEKIQRSLSLVTGLSFTAIGPRGKILAEAGDLALCRLLSGAEGNNGRCQDSCHAAADRARRERTTRFFRCRAGLECFAVPVRVDDRWVATILGGRVLGKAPDPGFFQDLAREHGLPEEKVLKAVGTLTLENSRNLARAADMVEQIADVFFSGMYHENLTQRRLALLTSLFQLATDLSPDKDPYEIHALIVNTVSILFDVEGACLFLHDAESGQFRLKTAFGTAEKYCLSLEFEPDRGIVEEVVTSREPKVSNDYHDLLRSGLPEQVRSAAFFPLLFGESVKGLLLIINTTFDRESTQLISAFCNQAAMAIQNTALRQQLKTHIEAASRLVRIQKRISTTLDGDALLAAIFDEVSQMTKAEQGSLMLLNRKTRELVVKLASGEHAPVIRKVSLGLGKGFAGKVAQRGRPLLVSDLEHDRRFVRKKRPRYRSNSFLIVPIVAGNRVLGVINLTDKSDGAFTTQDRDSLVSMLDHISIALQRSELYAMTRKLQKISTTDPLTQLLNRRYFQRRSNEEITRAQRYNLPLSLLMLDLDDFKSYNDQNGHLAGDNLLVGISRILREAVRSIDVVSRFGGEEFAVLSPQTRTSEAVTIAERIRGSVYQYPFVHGERQPLGNISISAGVATFPDQADSLQELLDNADRALYRAKRAGKNRVILFDRL